VSSYMSCVDSAIPPAVEFPPADAGFPAGMIAVRAAGVICPGGAATALLVAGSPVASGEPLVFAHPVTVAPAVVRRSGAVQAGGWLPDHVRLGLLEAQLGDGVIEAVIDGAVRAGRLARPVRRRLMSLELTCRFTVAMALSPECGYRETMARLAGHLAGMPWARRWHVPTTKVFTSWRRLLGWQVMEQLFWQAAGPVADPAAPLSAAALWCGLELCAIDGFQIDLPATDANRAEFGSSGTSDGSGPFPQARAVLVTARAARAMLGAAMDACRVGEQTLIARLVAGHPEIFAGRVFVVDRNFLGHELATAILDAGGHLVMRVRQGISLPSVPGGWLSDGSRMSYLNAPGGRVADRLPVRVAEHNVTVPGPDGETVSELYCLASTLLDHEQFPAEAIRQAYPQRWSASETTIGENKTTVTGAGPCTGPALRSQEPDLVRQEFWAWLTGAQLVRKSGAAALTTTAAGSRARPVAADQISFTAMRREAARSMVQTLVTAATSPAVLARLAEATSRAALGTLIVTGRQRHSGRRQKSRPRFPHTQVTTPTVTGPVTITRFHPEWAGSQAASTSLPG
jgi:Insertion element 4 transposase N-terminal